MRRLIYLLLTLSAGQSFGQDTFYLPLLDIRINVLNFGGDTSDVLLYNMHDNENTSAVAGRVFGEKYAGSYYELMHNGKRNLSFLIGEDSIHIDPNRIYTDAGIWLQLEKNESQDSTLFETIAAWRDSLLSLINLSGRSLVIALHNNTPKNYSFKSYTPGEEYANEAQALQKGGHRDKDDFYFVTDSAQFLSLSKGRYHVVLQSKLTLTDDGSLSVYCGQHGIPYINVEAQHGHLTRQIKMLIFAYRELVEGGDTDEETRKIHHQEKKELRELIKASKN